MGLMYTFITLNDDHTPPYQADLDNGCETVCLIIVLNVTSLCMCCICTGVTFVNWQTHLASTVSVWIWLCVWPIMDSFMETLMSLTWWLTTTVQSQCTTSHKWFLRPTLMHSGKQILTALVSHGFLICTKILLALWHTCHFSGTGICSIWIFGHYLNNLRMLCSKCSSV